MMRMMIIMMMMMMMIVLPPCGRAEEIQPIPGTAEQ